MTFSTYFLFILFYISLAGRYWSLTQDWHNNKWSIKKSLGNTRENCTFHIGHNLFRGHALPIQHLTHLYGKVFPYIVNWESSIFSWISHLSQFMLKKKQIVTSCKTLNAVDFRRRRFLGFLEGYSWLHVSTSVKRAYSWPRPPSNHNIYYPLSSGHITDIQMSVSAVSSSHMGGQLKSIIFSPRSPSWLVLALSLCGCPGIQSIFPFSERALVCRWPWKCWMSRPFITWTEEIF